MKVKPRPPRLYEDAKGLYFKTRTKKGKFKRTYIKSNKPKKQIIELILKNFTNASRKRSKSGKQPFKPTKWEPPVVSSSGSTSLVERYDQERKDRAHEQEVKTLKDAMNTMLASQGLPTTATYHPPAITYPSSTPSTSTPSAKSPRIVSSSTTSTPSTSTAPSPRSPSPPAKRKIKEILPPGKVKIKYSDGTKEVVDEKDVKSARNAAIALPDAEITAMIALMSPNHRDLIGEIANFVTGKDNAQKVYDKAMTRPEGPAIKKALIDAAKEIAKTKPKLARDKQNIITDKLVALNEHVKKTRLKPKLPPVPTGPASKEEEPPKKPTVPPVVITDDDIADIVKDIPEPPSGNGKNRQKAKDTLYDDQIDNIMRNLTKPEDGFKGVFAADEITTDLLKTISPTDKKVSWIQNLSPRKDSGSHWVAIFIDPLNDRSLEYYDSYGDEPSRKFMRDIKYVINKIDPNTYLKYKINRIKEQRENSSDCGYHSMQFLLQRIAGKKFKECTPYSDVIMSEEKLEPFKEKIKKEFDLI